MQRVLLFLLLVITGHSLAAQTLGGSSAYNFLRFPASPQLAALGGVNVAQSSNDVSLSFQNPALLHKDMHSQASFNFNSLYDGVKNYHWVQGFHHPKLNTNFAASVFFLITAALHKLMHPATVLVRCAHVTLQYSFQPPVNTWSAGIMASV